MSPGLGGAKSQVVLPSTVGRLPEDLVETGFLFAEQTRIPDSVVAVKIVGNNLGNSGSPGFDLANVRGLNIPEPSRAILSLLGLGAVLVRRWK